MAVAIVLAVEEYKFKIDIGKQKIQHDSIGAAGKY